MFTITQKNLNEVYMNKYISSVIMFFSCVTGMATLQGETLVNGNNDLIPGTQWTAEISKGFHEGKYSEFLGQVEARYEQGLETQEWDALKNRHGQKKCDRERTSECKDSFKKKRKNFRNYRKEWTQLRNDRNEALVAIANEYPDAAISKVIQDFQVYSSENSSRVCKRKQFKQFKDIRFKARVMNRLLSMAIFGDEEKVQKAGLGKISFEESNEYSYVLGLYEFQQMLDRVEDQEDIDAIIKIEMVKYDRLNANMHNELLLNTFVKEVDGSQNIADKKIIEVVNSFENQRQELTQKYQLGCTHHQQMIENTQEKSE